MELAVRVVVQVVGPDLDAVFASGEEQVVARAPYILALTAGIVVRLADGDAAEAVLLAMDQRSVGEAEVCEAET